MRRKLVLFDVDGTLISDGGAARAGFHEALRRVYRFEPMLDPYDFSGRTDPQIARMVLSDAGFSELDIEAGLENLWREYIAELRTRADEGHVRTLPGVRDLLDALSGSSWATLGLLTGNIEPGARLKLAPPELNRFFHFGAFGSDSLHREELPPIAADRAFLLEKHRYDGEDIVVIGDSIYDVRCAKPHRAITVAVASGRTPLSLLRPEKPDFLFESLEDFHGVIEAIVQSPAVERRIDPRRVPQDPDLVND